MQNKTLFSLALVGALTAAPLVHADEASLGGEGGNLFVEPNEFVQMQSEVINIDVYPSQPDLVDWDRYNLEDKRNYSGYAEFEVQYVFMNHSDEAVEVLMGFPEQDGYTEDYGLHDFQAQYLGEDDYYHDLELGFVDNSSDYTKPSWYTKSFTFPPGPTVFVNRYWTLASSYKGPFSWVEYTLETGASWAGVIEAAEIVVNLKDGLEVYDVEGLNPQVGFVYRPNQKQIRWTLENIEPTASDDIFVSYRDPNVEDWICKYDPVDSGRNASSVFPAYSEEIHYYPCNINDGNVRTAWVEDNLEGAVGEAIDLGIYSMGSKEYFAVDIFTGYAWDRETWLDNARPTRLLLSFFEPSDYQFFSWEEEPALSFELEIDDLFETQRIDLPQAISTDDYSKVRIEILDYVEGVSYPHDAAISEVKFVGKLLEGTKSDLSFFHADTLTFDLGVEVDQPLEKNEANKEIPEHLLPADPDNIVYTWPRPEDIRAYEFEQFFREAWPKLLVLGLVALAFIIGIPVVLIRSLRKNPNR